VYVGDKLVAVKLNVLVESCNSSSVALISNEYVVATPTDILP
jgi:hypothetical protein